MGITRTHRKLTAFSVILNEAVERTDLKWDCKGLLWYLLTKPDGWEIKASDLCHQFPQGIDAVQRMFRDLEAAGYVDQVSDDQWQLTQLSKCTVGGNDHD
jgi:Mn-dependent DtxR family transcriptional regulator